ncbi:MAG: DUF177 domain-containing protein [Flavobacteriales bacterium]|nr:DUF177 domain-containing protein [Flavobacteriales bacterium]MCB9192751.1 DUF177 domain-containing protein [Flavobacteriales bacterium]MCB9204891.1 DUF177 domain-containing protein [Flavobacteriales bacterium]
MDKTADFKVQFSGLKLGVHTFEFVVDNTFFEKLEYSPIDQGEVVVQVELEKKSSMLVLNFGIDGWVMENCDRCAVEYQQHVIGEHRIYVKFGDEYDEPDEDLLVLPREAYEIDLSQLIYEFIGLNIPLKKVPCDEDGDTSICDKETLKLLESAASEEEKTNPLWAKLNEIKDQLDDK